MSLNAGINYRLALPKTWFIVLHFCRRKHASTFNQCVAIGFKC